MTLLDEIQTGPLADALAPHVAVRHDAMVAKLLNEPTIPVLGHVTRADFVIWAAAGPRASIEDIAATSGHPLRASALTLLDFVRGASDTLDLGHASVASLFDAWAAMGAITAEQKAALEALGTRMIGRAEQAGLGVVHHAQVSAALNGS